MISSNTTQEVSCSDNSHIFGVPFKIVENLDAYMMIDRSEVRQWIERVAPLGIEFHFQYKTALLK